MSKHTEGPWVDNCYGQDAYVQCPDGRRFQVGDLIYHPENAANARLIAAAPDLLAALERLMDERNPFASDTETCECGDNGNGLDDDGNVCEHIQSQRAIAKAKGGQS